MRSVALSGHARHTSLVVLAVMAACVIIGVVTHVLIRSYTEQNAPVAVQSNGEVVSGICAADSRMRLCANIPAEVSLAPDQQDGRVLRSRQTLYASVTNVTRTIQAIDFPDNCVGPSPLINDAPSSLVCGRTPTRETYAPGETKLFSYPLDKLFLTTKVVLNPGSNTFSFRWQALHVQRQVHFLY